MSTNLIPENRMDELREMRLIERYVNAIKRYEITESLNDKENILVTRLDLASYRGVDAYVEACNALERKLIPIQNQNRYIPVLLNTLNDSVTMLLFGPEKTGGELRTKLLLEGNYLIQAVSQNLPTNEEDIASWLPNELVRAYIFDVLVVSGEWSSKVLIK